MIEDAKLLAISTLGVGSSVIIWVGVIDSCLRYEVLGSAGAQGLLNSRGCMSEPKGATVGKRFPWDHEAHDGQNGEVDCIPAWWLYCNSH